MPCPNAEAKLARYKHELTRLIAHTILDHEGEHGPHSIAQIAVEMAEANGLLEPLKELYAMHEREPR